MIDHVGDNIWKDLARLDLPPQLPLGIYDLLGTGIRRSHAGIARTLRPGYPELAARIDRVLETAPQVLSFGAAYQWVTALHAAMCADDTAMFTLLSDDFTRFECAAAILSAGDFDAGPLPARLRTGNTPPDPIAIPLVGAFDIEGSGLHVKNGELEGKFRSGRSVGGLRVDAFEVNYRLARSKSLFNLDRPGAWERGHDEIAAAKELGDRLVPGLFDRYLTDVVPLIREGNISNAGTDEAAPFVVYTSFERSPLDLVACFAHEEAHALINCADKILGGVLPETTARMPVPWKPGMLRSLSNVIHGLISFGRAAQVRGRAMLLGVADAENEQARDREAGWVRSVTDQLLKGALGDLPDELAEWMTTNVADLEPVLTSHGRFETVAGSVEPTAGFPWVLVTGPETVAAATERYSSLSTGPWHRGSGDYPDQDRMDIDLTDSPRLTDLLTVTIPETIARRFGSEVVLTAQKGHRLRPGDSIPTHTDHSEDASDFRAVIGASAIPTGGGLLRMCDETEQPVVALPLRHGDTLLFEITDPCYHDVTELRSDTFRYTIVATYARVPHDR